jgi:hypothetical protein
MPHGRHENAENGFWDAESAPAPTSASEYRDRATRLRALAADSPDPQIRAYLLTTASQFDRLADYTTSHAA